MGGEMDVVWADPAGLAVHFYVSLGCFLVFRVVIAGLQNHDELKAWFHLWRAGWVRRVRQMRQVWL